MTDYGLSEGGAPDQDVNVGSLPNLPSGCARILSSDSYAKTIMVQCPDDMAGETIKIGTLKWRCPLDGKEYDVPEYQISF